MSKVSETILAQLGGNKFIAMTGASSFAGGPDSLSFRLPPRAAKNKIKAIVITLTPDDLYTIKALTQQSRLPFEVSTVAERNGIHCDILQEVFTDMTGLATHL
jgi:hypothetical protein